MFVQFKIFYQNLPTNKKNCGFYKKKIKSNVIKSKKVSLMKFSKNRIIKSNQKTNALKKLPR